VHYGEKQANPHRETTLVAGEVLGIVRQTLVQHVIEGDDGAKREEEVWLSRADRKATTARMASPPCRFSTTTGCGSQAIGGVAGARRGGAGAPHDVDRSCG